MNMFKIILVIFFTFITVGLNAGPLTKLGKGEGNLNVVAWAGYLERGTTVAAFDWVTGFEKNTGCMVNIKTAGTSDEMVALMNEGGFDIVTASGDASLRLIAGETVQEINIDLIPSWNTIDPRLQDAAWHTVDGKHYGTPYMWGSNVLMYNTETFGDTTPDSWNVVFEEQNLPDGQSNKNRVQAFDGPIHIADAAMYLMYHQPELGIKDPYELTNDQYQASLNLLRQQRKLVGRYWHDAFMQIDDFTNEGFVASASWPFMVNLLVGAEQPIASVIPKEGATGWADTTMVHSEAANINCSYMWMEHQLSSNLQSDLGTWFGAVPSVPSKCGTGLMDPAAGIYPEGADACKINGIDNFDKIHFWRTPVSNCKTQDSCIPYYKWVTDYIAVLGGR
jgi:putative spermidine/putrescine transport system substrate-binding protein